MALHDAAEIEQREVLDVPSVDEKTPVSE